MTPFLLSAKVQSLLYYKAIAKQLCKTKSIPENSRLSEFCNEFFDDKLSYDSPSSISSRMQGMLKIEGEIIETKRIKNIYKKIPPRDVTEALNKHIENGNSPFVAVMSKQDSGFS